MLTIIQLGNHLQRVIPSINVIIKVYFRDNHKRAQGRPATTKLSPVIYFASSESKKFTAPAISSGTPNLLTPIPSAAIY